MKEQLLVNAILQFLTLRGAFVWRQNSGAMKAPATATTKRRFVQFNGAPGCSDIIGCLPDGRFVAIEAKIRPNKPTTQQLQFLERVTRAGGLAVVVYDLDEFIRGIEPHLRRSA